MQPGDCCTIGTISDGIGPISPMIRLSKLADYGIVLTTHLAVGRPGSLHAARDLAAATSIPLPTVAKVTKALAHAGVLTSHRGVGGGFSLARPANQITVAELIAALDGPIAVTDCLGEDHGACGIESTCGVRGHWDRINEAIRAALAGLTIEAMAKPSFPWERAKDRAGVP
jgi:FeS assembly SUF system regulator